MSMQKEKKDGLWNIIKPVMFEVKISMFLSAIGALSLIGTLVILSLTLTHIINGTNLEVFGITFTLFNTILLLTIMTIISFLSKLYSFVVSHLGAFRLEQILRTDISQHLAEVPLGYIITKGSGELKKVMQDDVRSLHSFVADSIPMIAKSIISPLLILIVLLLVDYRLAFVSLGILVLGWLFLALSMKDSKELRNKYIESQGDINKAVIEFTQAMPIVRTFDDGTSSFSKYNNSLLKYKENLNKWMKLSSTSAKLGMIILSPLPTLLSVLITGIVFLSNNSLELFPFIVALFLSTGLVESMMQLMWLQNFIKKSQASSIHIQEVLNVETLKYPEQTKIPNTFNIEFNNVSFKYDIAEKYTLKNINFKVKEGSITALVGSSGAGKSTVAKLVSRYWDINKGDITIGDVNVKDMAPDKLMDIVSFVFQDAFLFNDTIYNNIKMANTNASKEDIENATRTAQIHDFIVTLPKGYETRVSDRGTNLSGGQKQRITIARAILRDTPIVILDEATASTDPENEEKIVNALANLTANKTVIIVAHRLSTIKDADQIIVFDKGVISEIGNHNELLLNEGTYKKLWTNYKRASQWNLEKGKIYE